MKRHSTVRSAVQRALCVGAFATAAGYTPTVMAQGADGEELEEITVTGTRIQRQDYSSASPISTVDAQQFLDTGAPTIETVLNTLPQFVPATAPRRDHVHAWPGRCLHGPDIRRFCRLWRLRVRHPALRRLKAAGDALAAARLRGRLCRAGLAAGPGRPVRTHRAHAPKPRPSSLQLDPPLRPAIR